MKLETDILFHNHYTLVKLIGRGGFSEVWLAKDKYTHLEVALKIYAPGSGLDEDGIQLFCNEITAVYNLNHSNLLKPQHFDVCEGMPYLVLPYCKYGSCTKWIGKMGEDAVWHLLKDVSAGLAYLHSKEVIHQDIKPDNILVNSYNDFLLTDFGISTKTRSTMSKSMLKNSSDDAAGTMSYMGPERFGKDKSAVKASDIWALGATVFELMTGEVPFGNGVIGGGLLQKSGADLPDMPDSYSQPLRDLVVRMLNINPWDRPSAQDINAIANNPQKAVKSGPLSGGGTMPIGAGKKKIDEAGKKKKTDIDPTPSPHPKSKIGIIIGSICAVAVVALVVLFLYHAEIKSNTSQRDHYAAEFEEALQNASTDNLDAFNVAMSNLQSVYEYEQKGCSYNIYSQKKSELSEKLNDSYTFMERIHRTAVYGSDAENVAARKMERISNMRRQIK